MGCTTFSVLSFPSNKPEAESKFKVAHDNKYLYIAAEFDEPLMNKLKANVTKHDERVFDDDCIEIFLDVNKDQSNYCHLIINSLGTVYDAKRSQGGYLEFKKWDIEGLMSAVCKHSKSWTIEIAIPIVELGITSGNTGLWRFNIGRERKTKKEISSFMPLNGGFNQPTSFGDLQLENVDLSPYCWEIRAPYDQVVKYDKGKMSLSSKIYFSNQTGKFRFFEIQTRMLNNDITGSNSLGLAPNTGNVKLLNTPVGSNGDTMLNVKVVDRRSREVLAARLFPVNIHYSPLAINLIQPFYRNNIYATQNITELKGQISSSLSNLKNAEIKLKLIAPDNKVICSQIIPMRKSTENFCMPIPKLAYGTYKLSAVLNRVTGKKYNKTTFIRKLQPFNGEVRIDKNLVTRLNGKPFLPYGWYSYYPVSLLKQAQAHGYNVHVDYNAYFKSDKQLKKWLDDNHKHNLKVIIYPYPSVKYVIGENVRTPLSAREAAGIRDFVRKWKGHPAILAWYLVDEPTVRSVLPARIAGVRKICMEEDPYHPCLLLNQSAAGIRQYAHVTDILCPDPYPFFLNNGFSATPMTKIINRANTIHEAGKKQKAAWLTLQGFNYGDFGLVNNRAPNFTELRCMQYLSVFGGVTGFTWWSYYVAIPYPEIVEGVRFLRAETAILEKVILSPEKRQILKTDNQQIKVVYYKDIDKHDWIIAVNAAAKPEMLKLNLPAGAPKKWFVISENRVVNSKRGILNDKFKVYETHIYTTDKAVADKLSLAKAVKQIEKAKAAAIRPGNLLQEKKVKITVSSRRKQKYYLSHVFDGCRIDQGWQSVTSSNSWLRFDFTKPVAVNFVKLFSDVKTNIYLQSLQQGKWQDIAHLENTNKDELTASFKTVKGKSYRIFFKGKYLKRPNIKDIEIYNK